MASGLNTKVEENLDIPDSLRPGFYFPSAPACWRDEARSRTLKTSVIALSPPSFQTPCQSACSVGALLGLGSAWLPFPFDLASSMSPTHVQRPTVLPVLGTLASGPCDKRGRVSGLSLTQTTGPQRSSGSMVLVLFAWFPGVPVTTGQKLADNLQACPSCEGHTLGLP